jgi:hypothetical protein
MLSEVSNTVVMLDAILGEDLYTGLGKLDRHDIGSAKKGLNEFHND